MTSYHVRYRLHGIEHTQSFACLTIRALFVISLSPYAEILGEWAQ